MNPIRLICFDLGGVLVRCDPGAEEKLLSLANESELPILKTLIRDKFEHNQSSLSLNEQFQVGAIGAEEFMLALGNAFGDRISNERLHQAMSDWIVGDFPEVTRLLEPLSKIARLACFSNTHALHWDYILSTFSWMEKFEFKFASHLCGHAKPSREAFNSLCQAVKLEPAQCLLIDDRIVNIEGARSFGLNAIHYQNANDLVEQLKESEIFLTT